MYITTQITVNLKQCIYLLYLASVKCINNIFDINYYYIIFYVQNCLVAKAVLATYKFVAMSLFYAC